jgi:hydroxymethylbilane synthase
MNSSSTKKTLETHRLKLTIATRGSALALWQANHVRDRLLALEPSLMIELLILKTTGDLIQDRPLAEVGGKGLFVKEIEEALLDRRADIAVHSMKDVPAELAPGLTMAAISEREDPADALISRAGGGLADLPAGARLGTSSLRRASQLKAIRPDLVIIPLRGNVPTRIRRLDEGDLDAIVLAAAGLRRLGYEGRISERLDPETVSIPAAGQGALGIETREGDGGTIQLLRDSCQHEDDATCVLAERGFLAELFGGCQAPMAAHARLEGDQIRIIGLIGRPDGSEIIRGERRGPRAEATALGSALGRELLERGGAAILEAAVAATGGKA